MNDTDGLGFFLGGGGRGMVGDFTLIYRHVFSSMTFSL